MKYRIGAYVIDPGKPFKSIEEAVNHIQKRFPELEKETIERHLNPLLIKPKPLSEFGDKKGKNEIKEENGPDKHGGVHKETRASREGSSEDGSKLTKG